MLSGIDMSDNKTDKKRMRAYFLQCLGMSDFKPFPKKLTNTITFFPSEKISIAEGYFVM